jgi:RNA polymerase sigma-70 factor (ECF subfamily)
MRHATDVPATAGSSRDVGRQLDGYRRELTGFCYRMVGSAHDAEDAVQETMIRAWRGIDRFEGRSSLRSWLYRIATNVCYDELDGRRRRALPMDLEGPTPVAGARIGAPLEDAAWVQPVPDDRVLAGAADPADAVVERESIRLAFVSALQLLPPRQRAVLVLRDVLRWKASEVAELLGTTVVSVNSALQRARSTMADAEIPEESDDAGDQALVDRYVDAFERYDIDGIVALLRDDATLSMPPYALWLRGRDDIVAWYRGHGAGCSGSRLVPVEANGSPAFGQYRPSGPGGRHEPFALQVIETTSGRIRAIHAYLDTAALFPLFGLPATVPAPETVGVY